VKSVVFGIETLSPGNHVPRHQHFEAYATVVIDGAYEQISYAGRHRVEAGDVLIQPTLDAHADRMRSAGVTIARLPWYRDGGLARAFRLESIETIVREARTDPFAAARLVADAIAAKRPAPPCRADWPDLLAETLTGGSRVSVDAWAQQAGLARETVSRGFAQAFGVSPTRFRAELRARRAWLRCTGSAMPLAAIAAELGYADQAHMTRAIGALTGRTPALWRHVTKLQDESSMPA
jgi:AraC-like DNA-binding protein